MRPRRIDNAGTDWLITNRGLGKRAVFETKDDVLRFYDALSGVVELGLVDVHAFVFLTTHFHLLVHSRTGEISRALKLAVNEFVRGWNRTRKRDGPLFARRFHGRVIRDAVHYEAALRYIDLNPVRARMCRLPSDHPYGSARAMRHETGPEWLARERVISIVRGFLHPMAYEPRLYDRFASCVDPDANAYLVERLVANEAADPPPLLDLVRTATLRQQGWLEWKTALADGMRIGTAFLPPHESRRAATAAARALGRTDALPVRPASLERDLTAGLLLHASGRDVSELAADLGVARSTAHAALRRYHTWMERSPPYADMVARALQSAVRRVLPPPSSPLELPPRVGA